MLGSQRCHQKQSCAGIQDFPQDAFFRYQSPVQTEGEGQQHQPNQGQAVPVQPGKSLIESADKKPQQIFDMKQVAVRGSRDNPRRHIPHGHVVVDIIDKRHGLIDQKEPQPGQQKRQGESHGHSHASSIVPFFSVVAHSVFSCS